MNQLKNIKTTDAMTSMQSSNNSIQVFKPDMSKLLDLTTTMINRGEIKTDIEFAKKFMFAFDSEEKFPINLELLVEMKVYDTKGNLKTKLNKNFDKEVDYRIEKVASEKTKASLSKERGGQNKENIFLTVDCFKSLCMLANSKIGKQTKQYYLDLEKVFKTYVMFEFQQSQLQLEEANKTLQIKDNEIKKVEESRQKLLQRKRRTRYETHNACYILSHKCFTGYYKKDWFKIGLASQMTSRLSTYNTGAPEDYYVNAIFYVSNKYRFKD